MRRIFPAARTGHRRRGLIRRTNGTTARFTGDHVDRVPKTDFLTGKVEGDTANSELRLIIGGGAFDRSHRDNVIVYGFGVCRTRG